MERIEGPTEGELNQLLERLIDIEPTRPGEFNARDAHLAHLEKCKRENITPLSYRQILGRLTEAARRGVLETWLKRGTRYFREINHE